MELNELKHNTFTVTSKRIISLLIIPFVISVCIMALFSKGFSDWSLFNSAIELFGFILLYGFLVGAEIWLVANHFHFARHQKLVIENEIVGFSDNNTFLTFSKHEVVLIKEYRHKAYKVPWHNICYWDIYLPDKIIRVSNLIIDSNKFHQIFSVNKIETNHAFWASV